MVDGLNGAFWQAMSEENKQQREQRTKVGVTKKKDKTCWPAETFTSVYFLHIVQMNLQVGYLNAVDMHFEAMDYR